MTGLLVAALALGLGWDSKPAEPPPKLPPPPPPAMTEVEREALATLAGVRRIYVDRFTGGETAAQMRDLIIAGLQSTRRFTVTENPDRADAVLRGASEDLVFTEKHSSSESINARTSIGKSSSSSRDDRLLSGAGSVQIGDSESSHIEERRHEATATVRLVGKDGDVIWSTTQESRGGKFKGASADVADRVAKKLAEDFDRARRAR